MRLRRPDGQTVEWSSWHHRKGLGLLDAATRKPLNPSPTSARHRNFWIAGLFMVGSACFAVGSLPPLAAALRNNAAGVFFTGSLLFTAAAYLQFFEAANASPDVDGKRRTHRLLRLRAESVGWWAVTTQLAGTIAFNISTLAAMFDLSVWREQRLIWAPDMIGSICFLVASALVLSEVCTRPVCWAPASIPWWIAAANLAGSIAFGVSALAARILPTTGEPANIDLVNTGTFIGAVLFLVGAALLPTALPRPRHQVG